MTLGLHRLSARRVDSEKKVGMHSDGGGLYLRVQHSGSKSWVFIFQWNQKRREMGLGGLDSVSLARARVKAAEARAMVAEGVDPIAAKKATRAIPTFGELADEFIASQSQTTDSDKSIARWKRALGDGDGSYSKSIRSKRVDHVTTEDVLSIIRPIWLEKTTTAKTVRSYIERVLDAAKARGFRSGENPARFKGHLDTLLAGDAAPKRSVKHHAALRYADLPDFMKKLRAREAVAARALEFTILTAARTGETIGAVWSEFDLEAATWTVPGERMKAGEIHVIPLASECVDLLKGLQSADVKPDAFVFGNGAKAPSNMVMTMLMRRMGFGAFTVHGMRSAFRDFAGDCTDFPREIAEAALAHSLGTVERAYRRASALDKRRALMKAWAAYLKGKPVGIAPDASELVLPVSPMAPPSTKKSQAKANPYQVSIFDEAV